MKTLKTLIAVTGLLSIVPFASQAAAAPATTQTVAINYAQLDLGSAAGRDALYRQLANAAERACGAYESRDLRQRTAWRECRDAAFSVGIAQLVEAQLAAVR